MELATKYLFTLFLITYASTVFIGRVFIVWKKTKVFPITYSNTGSLHDFIGRIYKVLLAVSVISSVIYITSERLSAYLIPLRAIDTVTIKVFGLLLAYGSMLWTIIAQQQMGTSWRIGISENKTKLINNGLFRYSRHPIYLGVTITSFSLFLIMPNIVNLIVFLTTAIAMSVQARLEEEYLSKAHGEEYVRYRKNTKSLL
jgi:protein-S-isoprenylcysteine O-methyltransferase Ste14